MAITIQGNSGTVVEVGGTTFRGMHVHTKPCEYGSLGHYQAAFVTGTVTAGAQTDGELVQMRWVDATRFFVLQKALINGYVNLGAAFAANVVDFKLTKATAWTGDGTGGTAVTVSGQELRMRTSMGLSLFSTGFRFANGTAVLGAGTKTLNSNNHGMITTHTSAGPGSATPINVASMYLPIYELFEQDAADGEHPLVMVQNEGVVIRITNASASGTWRAGSTVKWAEVAAY